MSLVCHKHKVWRSLCRDWRVTKPKHRNCVSTDHEVCSPPASYKEDR